jgi:hypothetical protein
MRLFHLLLAATIAVMADCQPTTIEVYPEKPEPPWKFSAVAPKEQFAGFLFGAMIGWYADGRCNFRPSPLVFNPWRTNCREFAIGGSIKLGLESEVGNCKCRICLILF